jgi:hypothetical protein
MSAYRPGDDARLVAWIFAVLVVLCVLSAVVRGLAM